MDRTEFILATALVLFGAFLLGWFSCWLIGRLTRPGRADLRDLDRMADRLRRAEAERDAAGTARDQAEAELTARLAAVQAELDAALDGMRDSRAEIEELRNYIERRLGRR